MSKNFLATLKEFYIGKKFHRINSIEGVNLDYIIKDIYVEHDVNTVRFKSPGLAAKIQYESGEEKVLTLRELHYDTLVEPSNTPANNQ